MAVRDIRNPVQWTWDHVRETDHFVDWMDRAARRGREARDGHPTIRRIEVSDLREVLVNGLRDFGAYRTDVIFLCLVYPIAGLVLAHLAFGYGMLPLIFPLAAGFALLGPIAAVGLYEMSRRREEGREITWIDAFGVIRSPAFGSILVLGLVLVGIFLLWLMAAQLIYDMTLGPEPPASVGTFLADVITTGAGWAMIVIGMGVGFLFAALVLAISIVSFPLLLDRDIGLGAAVRTSIRAVRINPMPTAAWGLIVAVSLALGSIPFFVGLIVVLPVLGHATWHLYRRMIMSPSEPLQENA